MKQLTIFVPDSFTEAQCRFIINSAMNQVETEILNAVVIPDDITASAELEIADLKAALTPPGE